jgi:hypothetical protein
MAPPKTKPPKKPKPKPKVKKSKNAIKKSKPKSKPKKPKKATQKQPKMKQTRLTFSPQITPLKPPKGGGRMEDLGFPESSMAFGGDSGTGRTWAGGYYDGSPVLSGQSGISAFGVLLTYQMTEASILVNQIQTWRMDLLCFHWLVYLLFNRRHHYLFPMNQGNLEVNVNIRVPSKNYFQSKYLPAPRKGNE